MFRFNNPFPLSARQQFCAPIPGIWSSTVFKALLKLIFAMSIENWKVDLAPLLHGFKTEPRYSTYDREKKKTFTDQFWKRVLLLLWEESAIEIAESTVPGYCGIGWNWQGPSRVHFVPARWFVLYFVRNQNRHEWMVWSLFVVCCHPWSGRIDQIRWKYEERILVIW